MRKEYPLSQSAARADMDERTFRLLADRRIINATPRTRTQGRGKQKLYSTDEILIASILAPLVKLGADTFTLGELADSLRKHLGSDEFNRARNGVPVYVRLDYPEGTSWGFELNAALPHTSDADKADASNFCLPVTDVGRRESPATWSKAFIAIKLDDRITRVEWDIAAWCRANQSPSKVVEWFSDPEARQIVTKETPEPEFDAFLEIAKQCVTDGDKWPDA